ncbi:MAG TPA: OmpH family outer membrane protein [Acetobacteraceae bacterium]|nr:OmpH family outer membrane protein [Acetobacteraceae bacterium]
MVQYRSFRLAVLAATLLLPVGPGGWQAAHAQSNPGWFVPNTPKPAATPAPAPRRNRAPRPEAPPMQMAPLQQEPAGDAQAEAPPRQLPELPIPQLPALPHGAAPPAAVIGVLGVPEVLRASTAAQQVEKVMGERRDRLNQDAQKEQATLRGMQQSLVNDRARLSADQIRTRERQLQDRVSSEMRVFRERSRVLQEAAQVAMGQVERTLVAVIRQVAESRGMNLVLHRAQVALNVAEFDVTQQVTDQLNKVLPSVQVPPEDVDPVVWAEAQAKLLASPPAAAPAQQGH